MSVPGYYGCDCDKYNPDCRCYPRKEEPVASEPNTSDLREAVAERLHDWHRPFPAHRASECQAIVPCPMLADAAIAAVLDHLSRTANNIADAAARDRDQEHSEFWRQRAYWIQDERREAGQ